MSVSLHSHHARCLYCLRVLLPCVLLRNVLQEIKAVPTAAPKAVGSVNTSGSSSSSWGASISSMLEEFADPSTLAFCGVVLGACASALLVLGASAYLKSRQ